MVKGLTVHALDCDTLFKIAKDAAARANQGSSRDAIVAIVFSATACEAFLAELALVFRRPPEFPEFVHYDRFRTLGKMLNELERARAQAKAKYTFAKFILTGSSYQNDREPFAGFSSLIDLRNELVHLKPENMTLDPKERPPTGYEAYLIRLGHLEKLPPNQGKAMIHRVSNGSVANWAVRAGQEIIQSLWIEDLFAGPGAIDAKANYSFRFAPYFDPEWIERQTLHSSSPEFKALRAAEESKLKPLSDAIQTLQESSLKLAATTQLACEAIAFDSQFLRIAGTKEKIEAQILAVEEVLKNCNSKLDKLKQLELK